MNVHSIRRGAKWLAAGAGVVAGTYAAYAALTWLRYGKPAKAGPAEADEQLDRFMPDYEVVERHHIRVAAPAAVALVSAKNLNVLDSAVARALFKTRAWVLGGTTGARKLPRALADQAQAIGWRVLHETPGREIVFGAVTRPWEAEPEFRGVPPAEFADFNEPGYVKIVWTLRADPTGVETCIFRMETRVRSTDAAASAKFRRYWAFASPGVALLRRVMLAPVRCEAERRAQEARRDDPFAELRSAV
jgi:hypothetical protein